MKKICLSILALILLQGCGPTASIVSTGITIAQSGSTTRALAASGSGLFIKEKTEYWKNFLKDNLKVFFKETGSTITKKILENFDTELKKFKQVCPIEMLDKLDNPITLKSKIKKAS